MYLLADEKAVQAYNSTEYASKYQREMTVAEYSAGKRAYYNAREFFSEFIGNPFTLETLEKLFSKVRHTNGYSLVDMTLTSQKVMDDPLSRYIDIYVEDDGMCILVTLSEHNINEDVVGNVYMYDCYDQDITGLDYTYEDISPIAPCFVITNEDITKGNALDKMYKK